MARVVFKNIKKIYPIPKRDLKKKKNEGEQENKANLQITEKGVVAVQDFNLEIEDREFVVLVGPSGCGKSTTLRMVAGLEEITEGALYIGDQLANDVEPKDRNIAMVFQNYALYPHMTVYENMAFALKMHKTPKQIIEKKVKEAADILEIAPLLHRKPKTLSGGQRQRVAIGRAIVRDPQVFLMDEPLSNLDAKLRNQMRTEIIKLRQRIDTTFIYVTHDQVEAMTLGDRIVVMRDGFIQQIGTPEEVFNHPTNLFVAAFIGTPQMNFFDAGLIKDANGFHIAFCDTEIVLPKEVSEKLTEKGVNSKPITLGTRPEHIKIANTEQDGAIGKVDVLEMMGSEIYLHVKMDGQAVIIRTPTDALPREYRQYIPTGVNMRFTFSGNLVHIFDKDTQFNMI